MTQAKRILFSVVAMIFGYFLNAFGWTTKLRHPISTICLLLGLALFFGGLVIVIYIIIENIID
jgi:hypothetical protein